MGPLAGIELNQPQRWRDGEGKKVAERPTLHRQGAIGNGLQPPVHLQQQGGDALGAQQGQQGADQGLGEGLAGISSGIRLGSTAAELALKALDPAVKIGPSHLGAAADWFTLGREQNGGDAGLAGGFVIALQMHNGGGIGTGIGIDGLRLGFVRRK